MNMYAVFFAVIAFADAQQYGAVHGFDGFMRRIQEPARQFMIGKNLPHHVKLVPVLALHRGKGAARRFTNTHQVAAFVDIHIVAVVEGILIQPPAIFTLGVDHKRIRGDIERQSPARRAGIKNARIFIFFAVPVKFSALRRKGMGIYQIKAIFKSWRDFNNFRLLEI